MSQVIPTIDRQRTGDPQQAKLKCSDVNRRVRCVIPFVALVFAAAAEHHRLAAATRNVRHFAGAGIRGPTRWLPLPVTAAM